jgi:hypothetical protein
MEPTGYAETAVNIYGIALPFKIEPIVIPETLPNNRQSTLRNIPEERRSHIPYCHLFVSKCVNLVFDKSENFENDPFVLALKCWCVKVKSLVIR